MLGTGLFLAGAGASAADASPQGQTSSGPGFAVASTAVGQSAVTRAVTGAVTPDSTPPDQECRGQGLTGYYGWFGIAPGSSADGGVANDLWLDAKESAYDTPVQVYTGNGGANQQWCEIYNGNGKFGFYSLYGSQQLSQCLTVEGGASNDYASGLRVYADTCGQLPAGTSPQDQSWYVCPRSGNSVSLEPAGASLSSAWLDVRGGTSGNGTSAFQPLNPLQIWAGNGQDNQRFTLYPSPGEGSLSYSYTTGIAGC